MFECLDAWKIYRLGQTRPVKVVLSWLIFIVAMILANTATALPNPTDFWWNQSVRFAAIHPNSAQQIATLVKLGGFGFGALRIDFEIKVVRSHPRDRMLPVLAHLFGYYTPDGDPIGSLIPVPPGASIEGSRNMHCKTDAKDCHYIVKQGNTLYETWRASRSGNQLLARILVIWDLNKALPKSGRGDHCTSADAAGFPIQPLLWNADEIAASLAVDASGNGNIGHAIRFVLPNDRIASDPELGGRLGRLYVRPASHAGAPRGPKNSIAYGSRLRLRVNFPTDGYNPAARVIINTMKFYGIALADGGNIALTAESDHYTKTKWSDIGISSRTFDHPLRGRAIKASDFEVVNTGSRIAETYKCARN